MRVKNDFITREVAGEYLVIPVREAALHTKGLISLSESGYLLFQQLREDRTEEQLVRFMQREYDAPEDLIRRDVANFLTQMRRMDMLEEAV